MYKNHDICECEDCKLNIRLRVVEVAALLNKMNPAKNPAILAVGDRVRYYGAFNDHLEISPGVVQKLGKNGLVYVILDWYIENDGHKSKGPVGQWAHRKQLRKLKRNEK